MPPDVDASLSNALSSSPNVTAPSTPSPISDPNLNPNPSTPSPSSDDLEDLLDCRYGEYDPVSQFVETYGVTALANARDERRNNVLHMCAANGHDGSTPLHCACLGLVLLDCASIFGFAFSLWTERKEGIQSLEEDERPG